MSAKTFPLQAYCFFFQVEATLVFTEAHVSDEGLYFCTASLQDYPTYYASSQPAMLTVNGEGVYSGLRGHWDTFYLHFTRDCSFTMTSLIPVLYIPR